MQHLIFEPDRPRPRPRDPGDARAVEAWVDACHRTLAEVSHELKTPLMPVFLALGELLNDPATPPAVRQRVERIRHHLRTQTSLIDDLHDAARMQNRTLVLRSDRVHVHDAAREALEVCQPSFDDARVLVRLDLAATDDVVRGDRRRLLQVLWNLLQNAAKFTPEGGVVRVRSRSGPAADGRGPRLTVNVSDSGKGIGAARLSTIFDAFEGDSSGGRRGTANLGVGLTIARALAEAHGGSLAAHSDGRGKGATFALELPLLSPQTPDVPAAPADARSSPRGSSGARSRRPA